MGNHFFAAQLARPKTKEYVFRNFLEEIFMKTLAVFFSFAAFALQAEASALRCVPNQDNWQPKNVNKGFRIGKPGYGFSERQSCVNTVRSAGTRFVCNWNGSNYQPYDYWNNKHVGKVDYGFSEHSSCLTATENSTNKLICQWNGGNYQAHVFSGNVGIGTEGYGFSDLSSCTATINSASSSLICQWDGNAYTVYNYNTLQATSHRYEDFNDCLRFTESRSRPTPPPEEPSESIFQTLERTYLKALPKQSSELNENQLCSIPLSTQLHAKNPVVVVEGNHYKLNLTQPIEDCEMQTVGKPVYIWKPTVERILDSK